MNRKVLVCAAISGVMLSTVIPQCEAQSITNDEIAKQYGAEDSIKYAKDSNGVTWFYSLIDDEATIYGTNDPVKSVEIPEKIDGYKVKYVCGICVEYGPNDKDMINPNASKIQKVKIPSSVEGLSIYALDGCYNIKEIDMPANLLNDSMNICAFINCPNAKVNGSYHPEFADLRTPEGYKLGLFDVDNGKHKILVTGASSYKKGWADYNNKRYYFYAESGYMATGFIRLGNVHYYLDEAQNNLGNLVTGWKKINGSWYYFSPTACQNKEKGYMMTGWFGNYYFYGNGKMATGFINLNGSYYYLDESNTSNIGVRKTGWQKIKGSWYYFAKPGEAQYTGLMTKGWKQIGGVWYYFNSDGKMACNTTVGGYRLGADGTIVG